MKIMIVGRGWTGTKVYQELTRRGGHTLVFCSHTFAIGLMEQDRYDWVINCAGVTGIPNVDACEKDRLATLDGNALFPIRLYETSKKYNVRMAHFSSGCIYSGIITDVNADPNYFGSIYSISKGVSDVFLKDKAQVYRIRMPFTSIDEPKNYISKVMNYAKTGKLINSGKNSMTDLDEAVGIVCDLIEENAPNGPYNLVQSGSVDMYEFAEIFKLTPDWFTPEKFRASCAAGRSTCTIPAYEKMSDITSALEKAAQQLLQEVI
jgi:dTDP-4-dehydrorhamnose reductase